MQMLLELVPPKAVSLRKEIEEKFDIDLIQQQTEAGTLNFEVRIFILWKCVSDCVL
jgi:hypothetical protein